ncbi:hypothetical protein HOH30_02070, partial [Candidatus Woesearchaeota archaeon]|nr:hypothetical protein [Candidatus Woesearchaeota archaeon]
MKILTIHADFIEFKAKKKAIKDVADVDKVKKRAEECLVVFTAVEKRDEKNVDAIVEKYVQEIKNIAQQVNTKTIVLYPYAHLSSALSSPKVAEDVMKRAETILSDKYEVTRAPFGWYKSFTVACKGHPLSELSREFTVDGDNGKVVEKELNDTEIKSLLKQISRSRLDSSKLKDNDHRIIGKDLDLWSFNETAPGMVFWHNKGMIIKNLLIDYWREVHNKNGYQEISTPQIMDKKLWLLSGHWAKYKENMFITNYEKREFAVKPMNCPGGMLVYKASTKSYRDLPLRVGELGVVHRQELSGVLAGLFRLIQFTQDDAHIYCTEKQIESEVSKIIDIIKDMFSVFKLEFHHIELSTRPEKRIGTDDSWELAEKALENVLKEKKVEYTINEGDGAFYGP